MYASELLQKDREMVMCAVKTAPEILGTVGKLYANDREIMMLAVSVSGTNLKYADETLRNDKEIVMTAFSNVGKYDYFDDGLKYVSDALCNDKDVVMAAVLISGGKALQYVSRALKKDKDILLESITRDRIRDFSRSLTPYPTIAHIDPKLLDDFDFMVSAIGKDFDYMKFASKRLLRDPDFYKAAVLSVPTEERNFFKPLNGAPRCIKNNDELVAFILQDCSNDNFKYIGKHQRENKELFMKILEKTDVWSVLRYAGPTLRADKEFVLTVLKIRQHNFRAECKHVPKSLHEDKDIEDIVRDFWIKCYKQQGM